MGKNLEGCISLHQQPDRIFQKSRHIVPMIFRERLHASRWAAYPERHDVGSSLTLWSMEADVAVIIDRISPINR